MWWPRAKSVAGCSRRRRGCGCGGVRRVERPYGRHGGETGTPEPVAKIGCKDCGLHGGRRRPPSRHFATQGKDNMPQNRKTRIPVDGGEFAHNSFSAPLGHNRLTLYQTSSDLEQSGHLVPKLANQRPNGSDLIYGYRKDYVKWGGLELDTMPLWKWAIGNKMSRRAS